MKIYDIYWYIWCTIYLISFSKFTVVLPGFPCAGDFGYYWMDYLGGNVFNAFPYFPCFSFIKNISFLKVLRVNFRLS